SNTLITISSRHLLAPTQLKGLGRPPPRVSPYSHLERADYEATPAEHPAHLLRGIGELRSPRNRSCLRSQVQRLLRPCLWASIPLPAPGSLLLPRLGNPERTDHVVRDVDGHRVEIRVQADVQDLAHSALEVGVLEEYRSALQDDDRSRGASRS